MTDTNTQAQAVKLDREAAYQAYINEMTPNGNSRITNATLCAGPDERQQRHIATQMDMAFQAGWSAAINTDAIAALVGATLKLRHAVCGETGFAACVRIDSGKAYPWPALDEAEADVIAALARLGGGE